MLALLLPLTGAQPPLVEQSWVLDVMVATRTQVPVLGETRVYTRSTMWVRFEQGQAGLVQRQRLCAVEVTDDTRMAETVIPPAFVAAWPEQVFPVRVQAEGGATLYTADPGAVSVGYDPQTSGGAVPARPESPGVSDWEGDGHPGATVNLVVPVLGAIELYVAQRGHTLFSGSWDGASFTGAVAMQDFDQNTLGASHSLFDTSPETHFVPQLSGFRLTPIGAVSGCAQLAQVHRPGPPPRAVAAR